MLFDRDASGVRRRLAPRSAGRSLWFVAAGSGAGVAVVAAVIGIVAVAICWLPASAGSGSAASAIRAGVLAFLAAVHGGITVDGLPSAFVPLGMTLAVAALAWRAGSALAAVADALGERRRATLLQVAALQSTTFAAACGIAAHFATLGTSRVSALAATVAGLLLFAVSGGLAFVRSSALAEPVSAWFPGWTVSALRAAGAAGLVYLASGALLVAGSLAMHHDRVEALSRHVGGGWSGAPILLLGVLAAPNAAFAGAVYLAGPGFALGSGSLVSLGSTVHGTLPGFPVLGAVPAGPATVPVWLLAGVTPFVAGACAARVVGLRCPLRTGLRTVGVTAVVVALGGLVLAWQSGGPIGSGRLSAFGASPWQAGSAIGAAVGSVSATVLVAFAGLRWWRSRTAARTARPPLSAVASTAQPALPEESQPADDDSGAGVLAG